MTLEEFKQSVYNGKMPEGIDIYLQAMWLDARGKWSDAHHLIDSIENKIAYNVHAYLHRKEGDKWNANYWYSKAAIAMPVYSLEEEWEAIVKMLL